MECKGLNSDTEWLRNRLIVSVKFEESIVDVAKFIEHYPKIGEMTFIKSVSLNCVHGIKYVGGCEDSKSTDDDTVGDETGT